MLDGNHLCRELELRELFNLFSSPIASSLSLRDVAWCDSSPCNIIAQTGRRKERGPVSRNYTSLEFGISTALQLLALLRYATRANKLSHDFNTRQ